MNKNKLVLLSRSGCCLCKGLEDLIGNVSFDSFSPPLVLCVVNIDEPDVPEDIKARYSLEVPVLMLEIENPFRRFELPRASLRLSQEDLVTWLKKVIDKKLKTS